MRVLLYYPIFVLSLGFSVNYCVNGVSLEKELSLTLREKEILDQFKSEVEQRIPYDFMKHDLSLVRYLRATNFDVVRAEEMVLNTVEWRKQNRIDKINTEDWFDFELDYKCYSGGEDKLGRPIVSIFGGEWDIRRGVISGKAQKLTRYFWKCVEESSQKVLRAEAEGKNVTQAFFIYDMKGYNLMQQGCAQCIPVLMEFLFVYENHYPGSIHKIYIINAPGVFELVLNIMRPFMSHQTREALQVHGTDKSRWKRALNEEITDDNLLTDLGGSVTRYK